MNTEWVTLAIYQSESSQDKTYRVKLNVRTGIIGCNCPVWVYKKRAAPRAGANIRRGPQSCCPAERRRRRPKNVRIQHNWLYGTEKSNMHEEQKTLSGFNVPTREESKFDYELLNALGCLRMLNFAQILYVGRKLAEISDDDAYNILWRNKQTVRNDKIISRLRVMLSKNWIVPSADVGC